MSFIGEVCALATPELQREIHDMIKSHGAARGRVLWRLLNPREILEEQKPRREKLFTKPALLRILTRPGS